MPSPKCSCSQTFFTTARYRPAFSMIYHGIKKITSPTYKILLRFMVISDVYRSFIPNKTAFTKYCLTQWISKLPHKLWNSLSKALPDQFHISGGQSKRNCLQDQGNFRRSQASQIVLILNTVMGFRFSRSKIKAVNISASTVVNEYDNATGGSGMD